MNNRHEEGLQVFQEMLPDIPLDSSEAQRFASELGALSLENVFGSLWTRPGLDRRSRSLVTLGILIALRASGEMKYHFPIALRNGLTRAELEEVIYHATAYAGFPAASEAAQVASAMFDAE